MSIWSLVRKLGRMVNAETIALAIFSVATFLLPLMWEMVVAKTTITQSGGMRGFTATNLIVRYLFARFLGKLADWLQRVVPGTAKSGIMRSLANGLAVWLYQLPMYLVGAVAMGFSVRQVILVQGILLLESPLVGWLYRAILDRVRARVAAREEQYQ